MIVAPIPIILPISLTEPVKIIVFAMPFFEPHPIRLVLMVIPDVLIMMPGVLITTIIFSLSALLIPMVVLGQRSYRRKLGSAQQANAAITS